MRRAPVAPSLDLASRLLQDYAELQRASDRMLVSAVELGVNPNELGAIVRTQREMLGGFLALAVGQVDMLRVMAREPALALALAAARGEGAQKDFNPDEDHGHDEMGVPV